VPNDWDPQIEVQRIYNLREMMEACRERTPKVLERIDSLLADSTLDPGDQIRLFDLVLNRGYGRPAQQVQLRIDNYTDQDHKRVQIYIPDNNRHAIPGPTIDAEYSAQENN